MTEKEEKAIEYFKKQIEICVENANICDKNNFDEEAKFLREEKDYIDTVIQALEQKDKEIQELKADLYECNNIISDYIDTVKEKDKMIDLFKRRIVITENEHKEILKIQEKFLEKDFQDCLIIYFQKKVSEENE